MMDLPSNGRAVRNGAAVKRATWMGKPKAERAGVSKSFAAALG